jgi:DNA helicase HerA-like ATPase
MKFWVGYIIEPDGKVTNKPFYLDADMLRRHLGVFGTTGSGKTVFCKAILEEAARNRIPVIALDPQGDLASMALSGNPSKLAEKGISLDLLQDFKDKVAVRIFTPASTKGAPISVNPLIMPNRRADEEDVIRIIDNSSRTLIRVLIKTAGLPTTYESKAFAVVYEVLKRYWDKKRKISDLGELADLVVTDTKILGINLDKYMSERERERLSHALRSLTIGTSQLLFSRGEPIDFSKVIEPVKGKTPLNIFFLKTLRSEEEKMFFVSILLNQLYSWMLQQGSSPTPRLIFFTDEIAPFVPAGTLKPGPKDTYLMIFRQARKYGVICMAATQSPKDIDYKAFDQFNTLGLGRILSPQSQKAIAHLLDTAIGQRDQDPIVEEISHLTVCRFLVVNPALPGTVIRVKIRWLLTEHVTLTEEDIRRLAQGKQILSFEPPPQPKPPRKTVTPTKPIPTKGRLTRGQERAKQIPTRLPNIDHISHDDVINSLLARLEKIARTPFGLPFLRELVKEEKMDYEKARVYYVNEVRVAIKQGLAVVQREGKRRYLVYDFERLFLALTKKLRIDAGEVNIRHVRERFEGIVKRARITSILRRIVLGEPFLKY